MSSPKEIFNRLGKIIFDPDSKESRRFLAELTKDEIFQLLPDPEMRRHLLEETAFQENAVVFKKILDQVYADEDSLAALICGFERDEKYLNSRDRSDFSVSPDPRDIEKKRDALRQIALKILNEQKSQPAATAIPAMKLKLKK